jgi:hypothetical protein
VENLGESIRQRRDGALGVGEGRDETSPSASPSVGQKIKQGVQEAGEAVKEKTGEFSKWRRDLLNLLINTRNHFRR